VVDPTDRLEQAGLVVRRPNPADRRINVLTVTPRGAALRKRLINRLLEPPAAFRRLAPADQARLREVMLEALSGTGR
jgi:DNA-binding MarR family transcriptional regulator